MKIISSIDPTLILVDKVPDNYERHKVYVRLADVLRKSSAALCDGVNCFVCPIDVYCDADNSDGLLNKFFPELRETHPEYFI